MGGGVAHGLTLGYHPRMKQNVIISLTSIPRRFPDALPRAVEALARQSLRATIVVNIPAQYRKWGPVEPPSIPGAVVFAPSQDFGPGTKLLGALEYIADKPEIDYVITCDDDVLPRSRTHLEYLSRCAEASPSAAITMKGVALEKPPFRAGDGLRYRNKFRHVHLPAGFRGVVYPVRKLRNSSLPFTFANEFPDGVFNDDDFYFGALLQKLDIPLIAVPGRRLANAQGAGESGVAEKVELDRRDNEANLIRFALEKGFLRPDLPSLARAHKVRLALLYLRYGML